MEKWKILIFVTLIFTFVVCSKKDDKNNIEITSFKDSTLVAIVNDEPIHYSDVDDAARQMILQTGLSNKVNYKDSVIQHQALDWLIANTLLKQEAQQYMIEVKDEQVENAIELIKKRFPSEEKFLETLQQENTTMRKLRENVVLDLKVQKLLEQQVVLLTSEINTDEAKEYYQQNLSKFEEPGQARARHILIRVKDYAIEDEVEQARKKINSILVKVKQGENFSELAKTHSEGPTAPKGGDLGYFARGDMVKSFNEAVFSLKPGEVSDIVQTEFGFHIIKLIDFKASQEIPFEKVENDIKNFLQQSKSQEQFEKYIDQLKQKSKIKMRENV